MADYTFNTPPNWPTPPAGWTPPKGWVPDAAWGAAPDGWEFWTLAQPAAPAPAPAGPMEPGAPVSPPAPPPATAAKKKSKVGPIIAIVAGVAVLGLVIAGGVYVWNFLGTTPAGLPEEGFESASTVEEAHATLQQEHDEMIDYLESFDHGLDFVAHRDSIDQVLEDGLAATTISDVEVQTGTYEWMYEPMEEEHAAWEAQWAVDDSNLTNDTGTIQEEILDRISGGLAKVSVDSHCDSTACVDGDDPTVVHVIEKNMNSKTLIWEDVMRHEYAHVIQFKYEGRLEYGTEYEELFGSDEELHADCMSQALKPDFKTAYGSKCSTEMLESAGNVWDGIIF